MGPPSIVLPTLPLRSRWLVMIAAGYSACHVRERDSGNPAHTPPSARCTDRRNHLGDPGVDRNRHLCHRIRDLVPHDRVTGGPPADKLIMVTSRYPLAATTKTQSDCEGGHDAQPVDQR